MPFMCGVSDNRFTVMQWLYFVYFLGSVLGRVAVSLRPFHRIGSITACSAVSVQGAPTPCIRRLCR